MIAEYKGADDDDIVRWQSADGTVKTAHINDLILAYEPKKGKWILKDERWHCSECDDVAPKGIRWNFCPNCGVKIKMERREDEGTDEHI